MRLPAVAAVMTRRRWAAARNQAAGHGQVEARTTPVVSLRPFRCDCHALGVLLLTATAVGLLTGFFGVGGGFAVVPALVLAMRLPMPVAVGTSLVVITINSARSRALSAGEKCAAFRTNAMISSSDARSSCRAPLLKTPGQRAVQPDSTISPTSSTSSRRVSPRHRAAPFMRPS